MHELVPLQSAGGGAGCGLALAGAHTAPRPLGGVITLGTLYNDMGID